MQKKIIIMVVTLLLLLAGCNNKENEQAKYNGTSENEINKMLKQVHEHKIILETGVPPTDYGVKNAFELLKPTHKQTGDYPYECIFTSVELFEESEENILNQLNYLYTPNIAIKDMKCIKSYEIDSIRNDKEVETWEEFYSLEFRSQAEVTLRLDVDKAGLSNNAYVDETPLEYDTFVLYSDDSFTYITVEEALRRGSWKCEPYKFIDTDNLDVYFEDYATAEDSFEIFSSMVKKWGLPSEIYVNTPKSKYTSPEMAYIVYDCDGYDCVFQVERNQTSGNISYESFTIYGDYYGTEENPYHFQIDENFRQVQ